MQFSTSSKKPHPFWGMGGEGSQRPNDIKGKI
jgi:hypothetical protein